MFSVSIVIPNYNNEKYLKECLDSVLNQTYPIKEIIVFDDCSTDNSTSLLTKYQKSYNNIKVIFSKINVGVSCARDIAIKQATSDYICVLDSDDYFYSTKKIESEMDTVKNYFNKTLKKCISFSQTIDVNENGKPFKSPRYVNLSNNIKFKIKTRLFGKYMPRDYCFPKEAYLSALGFNKNLNLFEDWDLNCRFLNVCEFVYSDQFGTAYRHKNNGLSSVNAKKQFVAKVNIFKQLNSTFLESIVFYAIAFMNLIKNSLLR